MCAKPTKGLNDLLSNNICTEKDYIIENKYDGERIQVHLLDSLLQ